MEAATNCSYWAQVTVLDPPSPIGEGGMQGETAMQMMMKMQCKTNCK